MVIKNIYIPYELYDAIARNCQQPYFAKGAFPDKQLEFILSDFSGYLSVMVKSFWSRQQFLLNSFIGNLGWLDTPMPSIYLLFAKVILVFFAFFEMGRQIKIELKNRLILGLCFLGTFFMVFTSMYLSWSPVGSSDIKGVQGRYFIAVSPVFFLLLHNRRFNIRDNYVGLAGSIFVFISLLLALYMLLQRFYI